MRVSWQSRVALERQAINGTASLDASQTSLSLCCALCSDLDQRICIAVYVALELLYFPLEYKISRVVVVADRDLITYRQVLPS